MEDIEVDSRVVEIAVYLGDCAKVRLETRSSINGFANVVDQPK